MKPIIIVVLFAVLLFGCKNESPTSTANQNQGSGGMSLAFNKSEIPSNVAVITATLSREGYTSIIKNLNILTDTSAEISIPEVLVGTWNLKVDAKDVNGTLLYTGEAQVVVVAGQTVNITLTLQQVSQTQTGTVKIVVTWANTNSLIFPKFYGGTENDMGICILPTSDNGYLLGGINRSNGNGGDAWLLKVNFAGELIWSKTYGGLGEDRIDDMIQTSDGGYLLAGYTTVNGEDSWVVKIDSVGNKIWEKNYGVAGQDAIWKIASGLDGTFWLCGYVSISGKFYDGMISKISSNGELLWSKNYGGTGGDFAMNILPRSDGSLIVLGYNGSIPNQTYDFWIFKLNDSGNMQWEKMYGGSGDDRVGGIIEASSDGDFFVSGYTISSTGQDAWILRLNNNGEKIWAKTYGGSGTDYFNSLQKLSDGKIIASGYTTSFGNSLQGWMMSFDINGNTLWSKTYGASKDETIYNHVVTNNGLAFIGWSNNTKNGDNDYWFGVTDFNGNLQ